jgi:hypothetical protein
MAFGGGKYDAELSMVRAMCPFSIGCLIILGGPRGYGFDVQMQGRPEDSVGGFVADLREFSKALRTVAKQVERDAEAVERSGKIPGAAKQS